VDLLMKKLLIAALALTVLPIAAQAQAPAADSKNQSIQTAESGWQTICRPSAKDRAKQDCSVIYETFVANDRLRIAAVEFARGEKSRVLNVSVPMGVALKEGIEITIDGANKMQSAYTSCLNNGCIVSMDLADKTLDIIKKGKILSVSFSDANGNKVKADMSLVGFTAAINRAD
jgi:invasion protein IalB